MKKLFTIFTILILFAGLTSAQTGVFFSEYIEGGSFNKSLEIYNGTGSDIDLSNYRVILAANGAATPGKTLILSGTLTAGEVYVVSHSSSGDAILDVSDTTSLVANFNGDDFSGLQFNNAGVWETIDVIGVLGTDPGTAWEVAGIADVAKDHTLIRKESVTTGNTDWATSAGTSTENSEWEVKDKDTFDYLGQHPGMAPAEMPKVFFSEYIEGGSNNKALEIYNGTGSDIDLSNYVILQNSNGGPIDEYVDTLSGTLLAGDVYVIANASSDSLILAEADLTGSGICYFNGDDARGLAVFDSSGLTTVYNKDSTAFKVTVLDYIGSFPDDPGSGWSVAGVADGTKDYTLVRKESVTMGNTDWAASAGTTTEDSEWIVYDQNNFDYIGLHPGTNVVAPTEPTEAAPTPTVAEADVISLFSDAYTDVVVDTWSTDWDNADVTDSLVAGNATKLYTNLVFAGIETASQTIDASEMTHFHMDIWTPDESVDSAVFKIKLVDFGANGVWEASGDNVEHEITLSAETTPALLFGEWVSIDIPLSEFTGLTTTEHMAQYIISGDPNTVYVDNMYFYKEPPPAEDDLFFSEYIEGGSYNKALEIYNGTGAEVDLADYVIRSNSSGGDWFEVFTFGPNAKLADGEVYVIAHADAGPEITAVADTLVINPYSGGTSSVANFNGDDGRALCKVNGTDTTIIDIIGLNDLVDPGSGWAVAGVANGTQDHSLVRKESVTIGNTDWAASAGTTTENSEWIVYDKDTFDYLGQHPGMAPTEKPIITSVKRNVMVPAADQSTDVMAEVTAENGLASVSLIYSTNGEDFTTVAMSSSNDTLWTGSIPSSVYDDGDLFGYLVVAEDNIGQTTETDTSMILAGTSPIERIKDQTLEDGSLEFDGLVARVTGTVSAGTGTYSTGRIEAYMQDTTAGILVFYYGVEDPPMVENHSYTVTGEILQYKGLIEIEPFDPDLDIIDNGAVTPLVPMEVSIADINADPEYYQSRLVKVNNVELSSETLWLSGDVYGSDMDIFAGTDSMVLRVDADTDIWDTATPEFPQDITGVLSQYNIFQLLPRNLEDFSIPVSVENENGLPVVYALEQNYPNPFNPSTKINFSIPENGVVTLKVFDILGKEVMTLVDEVMPASHHTVEFDASMLSSGIYFYRIQVNSFVSVKKMMLIK